MLKRTQNLFMWNHLSLFSLSAKMTKGGCIEKSTYDEINAEESKCQTKNTETVCVCDTDLCNDGKDDQSGVEKMIPQFMMVFTSSIFVFYLFMWNTNRK